MWKIIYSHKCCHCFNFFLYYKYFTYGTHFKWWSQQQKTWYAFGYRRNFFLTFNHKNTYNDISFFQAWWGNLYVSLRLFSQSSFFNWLCNEGFYLCRRVTSDVFYVDVPFRWFHAFGWGKDFGFWIHTKFFEKSSKCDKNIWPKNEEKIWFFF